MSRLFLITGVPAAGKSTVGHAPARRFERGVCVDGDDIRRAVVRETPRVGLRPDTSSQSVEETVDRILERLRQSAVSRLR